MQVERVRAETFHGRKGPVQNAFRYSVDYVLLDAERARGPSLFSRNRANLMSLQDTDHGGMPGSGKGAAWAREVLASHDLAHDRLLLLAQPRLLGHVFNPVSFWLAHDHIGNLRAVIAEVSNTFGDRHSYLCHRADRAPIGREDTMTAQKIFHVSPFQPIAGSYAFRFDIRPDRIGIWIDYSTTSGGLYTNLIGAREVLTNRGILASALRRPFGSRRVLALIHWQALKLWLKKARFNRRPLPPKEDVSQ
ncbi:MAG: cyclopropane-fatty-acyl-phospholipid synthase [Rhodobacterales bacterium 12-65-15]|nr:MAG: cyclopropane-fatty-acyl-phospholipid synthase [Rhodobacterales bacterium 12-65-15]